MRALVASLAAGLVFGTGIALSGMANPAKVLNFFDIAGTWDPSLAFVMGGALAVAALGYKLLFDIRHKPLLAKVFQVPTSRTIDLRLVGGSALFGIGWGIAGFCPGGAIPALGIAPIRAGMFLAAMLAGITLARLAQKLSARALPLATTASR